MTDIRTLKYELYCKVCDQPIGYTDHKFEKGDIISAERCFLPNGEHPKTGDKMICGCVNCLYFQIRYRDNPYYCEDCGGTGEISTDESDGEGHIMRGVGSKKCHCRIISQDNEDDQDKD